MRIAHFEHRSIVQPIQCSGTPFWAQMQIAKVFWVDHLCYGCQAIGCFWVLEFWLRNPIEFGTCKSPLRNALFSEGGGQTICFLHTQIAKLNQRASHDSRRKCVGEMFEAFRLPWAVQWYLTWRLFWDISDTIWIYRFHQRIKVQMTISPLGEGWEEKGQGEGEGEGKGQRQGERQGWSFPRGVWEEAGFLLGWAFQLVSGQEPSGTTGVGELTVVPDLPDLPCQLGSNPPRPRSSGQPVPPVRTGISSAKRFG